MNKPTSPTETVDNPLALSLRNSDDQVSPSELHAWAHEMIDRIESFMAAQLHRFDGAMALCRQAMNEGEAARRLAADFKQEQAGWTTQRDNEIKRLQEASDLLAQGWSQLEDERRELIKLQHSTVTSCETTSPSPGDMQPVVYGQDGASAFELLTNVKQLKREMQQHAERHP